MPRGRPKKIIEQQPQSSLNCCTFPNTCSNKYLCCNFCKEQKCDVRCKDKHEECGYLCDEAFATRFDFVKHNRLMDGIKKKMEEDAAKSKPSKKAMKEAEEQQVKEEIKKRKSVK